MRKVSLTLIAILIFSLALTVSAFADDANVVMEIPQSINLNAAQSTQIKLSGSMPLSKKAFVSIGTDEGFVMRNELNPNSTVPYAVYCDGRAVSTGDTIISAKASELSTGKISTISFNLSAYPGTAGRFLDVLTFSLSFTDNPLSSIQVTSGPAKTEYTVGESFDPTGMVVTAFYADGSTATVTGYSIAGGSNLTADSSYVTVCYTENGVTKTAAVSISMKALIPRISNYSYWYKGSYDRSGIQTVSFVDSYTPTGAENETWDASYSGDGTVMAYRLGSTVIVAGNGSGYIKSGEYMNSMFANFQSLNTINGFSLIDTSEATGMASMFYNCVSLTSLDVSSFNTANVQDMSYMFYLCEKLTNLSGLSNFNTSNVTNMYAMFGFCYVVPQLDVGGFDTSRVNNMMYMFIGNNKLTSLPISNWNTASVQNIQEMFAGCETLNSLDLSRWNTSNVTNMHGVFTGCRGLTSLNTTGWDTSRVTTMRRMYLDCPSLGSLDLRHYNTSNVTDMSAMFQSCTGVRTIDLCGLDTSKVTDMSNMFENCPQLSTIYVNGSFSTASVTSSDKMFNLSGSLMGAISYDPTKLDAAYANYTNGYFTYKAA